MAQNRNVNSTTYRSKKFQTIVLNMFAFDYLWNVHNIIGKTNSLFTTFLSQHFLVFSLEVDSDCEFSVFRFWNRNSHRKNLCCATPKIWTLCKCRLELWHKYRYNLRQKESEGKRESYSTLTGVSVSFSHIWYFIVLILECIHGSNKYMKIVDVIQNTVHSISDQKKFTV